jgi:hypothetical protein
VTAPAHTAGLAAIQVKTVYGASAAVTAVCVPKTTSVQLRRHVGTRGGCRRGGRVGVCRGG